MKYRIPLYILISGTISNPAYAQGSDKTDLSAKFSYFTAGFALLFFAVFLFTFCFKTLRNQKTQEKSSKQIAWSSLRIALLSALLLIIGIYVFLNSVG